MGQNRLDSLMPLLKEIAGYELVIAWKPAQGNPLLLSYVRVNGLLLAHEEPRRAGPARFHLPIPEGGSYFVEWSVRLEVPLDGIIVGVMNEATGSSVKVDSAEGLARGQIWSSEVTVDAPK